MMTQIGLVAGEILNLLEEKKKPMSIDEIACHLGEAIDVINMSVGWLVRERHVSMMTKVNKKYLTLLPSERFASAMSCNG